MKGLREKKYAELQRHPPSHQVWQIMMLGWVSSSIFSCHSPQSDYLYKISSFSAHFHHETMDATASSSSFIKAESKWGGPQHTTMLQLSFLLSVRKELGKRKIFTSFFQLLCTFIHIFCPKYVLSLLVSKGSMQFFAVHVAMGINNKNPILTATAEN